jgi:single-strand DNA-binding protein
MSNVQITGTLHRIFETKQVSERFSKREFVVETEGKYPQLILCELTKDKCTKLDEFSEGDAVLCELNLRGREWSGRDGTKKYFVSLDCWRIVPVGGEQKRGGSHDPAPAAGEDQSDLPF